MGKKAVTKLTIAELIKRKEQLSNRKNEHRELYIKSLDRKITIQKPDRSIILESYGMQEGEGNKFLVYECVTEPNLKDSELQKAFDVKVPTDIVDEIFDPGVVDTISKEIVIFAGYEEGAVSLVNDVKNS
ncbi:phage portal protein [Clostridium sp. MB40-C1]|uniref:phage tail assembly chaperone n=1 Tax=Clostridium sp. MB40-C1 TaxID=3070996 RepID=UPI0027DF865F|nr:phage portal protein [Clostridium sp. MB40-C1]WMJ80992.1 phage portal protein [Clostridium sp. MB40-C1]